MQRTLRVARSTNNVFQLARMNSKMYANVLECLCEEELTSLIQALGNGEYEEFLRMAQMRLVYTRYFAKVDRTYYFSVYEHPQMTKIELEHIYQLEQEQKYAKIETFPQKFNVLLKNIEKMLPIHIGQEFSKNLHSLIVKPDVPMPKLLRESVSGFANSAYQSFICSLQDSDNLNLGFMQEATENLLNHVEQNEQSYFVKVMNTDENITKNLRYFAHEVTYNNLNNFYAPNNELHNILAVVLGLTELYLSQVKEYLETVEDPLELLLQFSSRYLQFQSTLVNFQENYGFMFHTFDQIYAEIYGGSNLSKFSYYKPAMKMWKNIMSEFHERTNSAYLNLLQQKLSSSFQEIAQNCGNGMLSRTLLSLKNKALETEENLSNVYEIMKMNYPNDIQMLVASYGEYLVDLSITEQNCGYFAYSKFKFDENYATMEEYLSQNQHQFLKNFEIMYQQSTSADIEGILQQRLKAYHQFVKPSTVSKIMELYNQKGLGIFQMPEIQETDELIEAYNRGKIHPDVFCKPLEDDSTMHSENSQSASSILHYESEEYAMEEEIGGGVQQI